MAETDEHGGPRSIGTAPRPGSRAANRAAKRVVTGVWPKTQARGARRRSGSNTGLLLAVAGAIAIAAAVIVLGNPFGSPADSPSPDPIVGDGTCPTSQPAPLPAGQTRTVTLTTPKGTIVLKVDGALSPIAAGNFVALIACHFYDGSVFHRLVPNFVIQGGAAKDGSGSIPYKIEDEKVTATYKRGTVAMARTSQPNSQTSQFFIVLDDDANAALSRAQYGYSILGEVSEGMSVVDVIAAMPSSGEPDNQALSPVEMTLVEASSP